MEIGLVFLFMVVVVIAATESLAHHLPILQHPLVVFTKDLRHPRNVMQANALVARHV